jgi:hypothetical protein
MIKITSEHGEVFCDAKTRGFCVYLDTWALLDLARGLESRQQRVTDSIRQGGTLLFSFANALEIGDLSGASSDAVQNLLNSIGQYWFPLEMNPWKVAEREKEGFVLSAPFADSLMKTFFQKRAHDLSSNENELLNLSESFFSLGSVLNWVKENKEKAQTDKGRLDQALEDRIKRMRAEYDNDRASY